MIEAVTFDLDSTIAHTLHRQWMVDDIMAKKPGGPTWDDYSMACANDTPIGGTVALMRTLPRWAGMPIFIITGRSAAARELTETWLHGWRIPFDGIRMRPAGDQTPNGKFKVAQILAFREEGYDVILHVEDDTSAAEYITDHTGIPCLLVNANYPADAPHQDKRTRGV